MSLIDLQILTHLVGDLNPGVNFLELPLYCVRRT